MNLKITLKNKWKEQFFSLFILLSLLYITESCHHNKIIEETSVAFTYDEYNFGNLIHHLPQSCSFEMKNTGDKPLIIENVEVSCGCTSVEWGKKPIKPGKSTALELVYDSDYPGRFRKSIQVYSNAIGSPHTLVIKGEVIQNE